MVRFQRYLFIPRRTFSSPSVSYDPSLLSHYSQTALSKVTYDDLAGYGSPPLETEKLIANGEKTRQLLLIGLAGRVRAHQGLPYLPATNPSLRKISELYESAFSDLARLSPVASVADNDALCASVARMVDQHRDNIPVLAQGFRECHRYLPETVVAGFLDGAIMNRISLRLLGEHHVLLSQGRGGLLAEVDTRALVVAATQSVQDLCDATYGVAPNFTISTTEDNAPLTARVIPGHVEYILTELLKNAFRATVEHNSPPPSSADMYDDPDVFRFLDTPLAHLSPSDFPPVQITLGIADDVLTVRIRDQGSGIPPSHLSSVFSYSFTSVSDLPSPDSDPDSRDVYGDGMGSAAGGVYGGVGGAGAHLINNGALNSSLGTLAGLGFGLPLSRIYAEYFGGSLDLVSIENHGCDVYAVIRTVHMGQSAFGKVNPFRIKTRRRTPPIGR